MRNTKRSLVLGTILALSLAVIIAVAAVAPTIAWSKPSDPTLYSTGGQATLQLPPGGGTLATRPTALKIYVDHFDRWSDFGACDQMIVSRWIPSLNTMMPVAIITDSDNADYIALLKAAWAGWPVWIPSKMENVIQVEDDELEVWSRGGVVTANLTKTVSISLPFQLSPAPYTALGNLSFTLPPTTMVFRGIGDVYSDQSTSDFSKSLGLSGYKITFKAVDKPAWVSVEVPAWLKGGGGVEFVGILNLHETMTYIAPPP